MTAAAVVMVEFRSADDAARWFRAARFAGNVPAGSGLAFADTLDLPVGRVPHGALVITAEPARRYVVDPPTGCPEADR